VPKHRIIEYKRVEVKTGEFISAVELGSEHDSDSASAPKRVRISSYCFNMKKEAQPLFET
jgi:hypothetical protein